MMVLVIGGSGSGKSAYAEEYVAAHANGRTVYYIATMQVYDDEGAKKVERHRNMRKDRHFVTIEQPQNVEMAREEMHCPTQSAALLECVSNLTANEMFSDGNIAEAKAVADKIVDGIRNLQEHTGLLVIVSNNVFETGECYDETTMRYLDALGIINARLAELADEVVEVVVGIPVEIKGARKEIK